MNVIDSRGIIFSIRASPFSFYIKADMKSILPGIDSVI